MSVLFIVENKSVKPNAETLLVPPFKNIWNRDKTKGKTFALEDFAYIEFVSSVKKTNPYAGYKEKEKKEKVKNDIITKKDWVEDELILQAIEKVTQFQQKASTTYNYYMSAKIAAEKMDDFFKNFDMNECNLKTGNPIYKPRDITSALNDTTKVLENLNALKEKVEQDLYESTKTKGQKEISPFANPESI